MTIAGERVAFASGHARAEVLHGAALRAAHQLVDHALPLVGATAHDHRAGEVRAVSVHLRTEVKQQPLAPAHGPVAGAGVGQRRARTRGDDGRKGMPLAAPAAQRAFQRRPDLPLALAHAGR